ncbi:MULTISPECIES: S24 family peptidase [Mangrovibacter]|uniref:helix-turn-helix domain-containing protein n=1 Tax=Mangrovibacter TaxID=451512 RepID=UPI000A0194F3|nr:S24 family peptidase [Mangrovibacter sp. MFB070]
MEFEESKDWLTAKDAAGLPDMPTTPRRARDILDRASYDRPDLRRKRKGTKATEYHISVLPPAAKLAYKSEGSKQSVNDVPSPNYTVEKAEPDSYDNFLDEFALIPGYRIQVSAGYGSFNDDGISPCRHLAFRRKWLSYRGFHEKDLVVVWAKGDSMEPTISNNDTLLINTADARPSDGNMYVIRQDDLLWVKRFQIQPNGAWVLISDNTTYPPMPISKSELHNFEVIGRVVHIAKDV